jgi:nucleoside-diphosphate-sugar epimerase
MAGRVLVTGASGFIGRALVQALAADGWLVRAAMRRGGPAFGPGIEVAALPDLSHPFEWTELLAGVDVVIHLAGIAHTGRGVSEQRYDRVNRAATAELAAAAAAGGIRRFILMSSISAQSSPASDRVLTEADVPHPTSAYGRSKLAAEQAVAASGVPFTILRPVVIYGPGAKGNVQTMLRAARSTWPLPFARFHNRRSLLGIDNLIAAVRLAATSPEALGQTYVVADPTPMTLAQVLTVLRKALGRPPRLVPVPQPLFAALLRALGRPDLWDRLGGSLVIDPAKLIAAGWRPTVDPAVGLFALARAGNLGDAILSSRPSEARAGTHAPLSARRWLMVPGSRSPGARPGSLGGDDS